MKFEHPHLLNKQEARRRVEQLGDFWRSKYGVAVSWQGDSASLSGNFKGITFDAKLTVGESSVAAEGTDPGFLMRSMASAYFKGKLSDYLDPKKNIEELDRA